MTPNLEALIAKLISPELREYHAQKCIDGKELPRSTLDVYYVFYRAFDAATANQAVLVEMLKKAIEGLEFNADHPDWRVHLKPQATLYDIRRIAAEALGKLC